MSKKQKRDIKTSQHAKRMTQPTSQSIATGKIQGFTSVLEQMRGNSDKHMSARLRSAYAGAAGFQAKNVSSSIQNEKELRIG